MAIYRQEKDENGNALLDSDGNPKMILIRADEPNEEIFMVYEVETLEQKAIRLSNELNDVINQLKNTTP